MQKRSVSGAQLELRGASSLPAGEGPPRSGGGGELISASTRGRPASSLPATIARSLRRRMTRQEVKLWLQLRILKSVGFHFRRQVPIERFVVDFACLKHRLVIELDGSQHCLPDHSQSDRARDDFLESLGFRVVRFWNGDVDRNLDGVIESILAQLTNPRVPTPDAARRTLPCGEG